MPRDFAAEKRRLIDEVVKWESEHRLRMAVESALDAYAALVAQEQAEELARLREHAAAHLRGKSEALDELDAMRLLAGERYREIAAKDEEIARLKAQLVDAEAALRGFGVVASGACPAFIRLQHAGQWQADSCAQCGRPEAEHQEASRG